MKDELQKRVTDISTSVKSGARSMVRTTVRIVKWVVILAVVIGGLSMWFLYSANYSEGSRSGRLIKISYKGVVFKTWEGQLDVGGISGGGTDGGITTLWDFTVPAGNQALIEQLDQLSGRRVKLYYHEKYYAFPWRGDTKYFIQRVEENPAP